MRISFVIVTYNAGPALGRCLDSIIPRLRSDLDEVVVVDNHSIDGSTEVVREAFPGVAVLANERNLGFAAACNQGARAANGEYLFFVNPDLTFPGPTWEDLATFLDAHPEAAAAGPRLIYPDGSLQPSRGRFPTMLTTLAALWDLKAVMPGDERVIRVAGGLLGRLFAQYRPLENEQRVDYVTGACLMVRRSAFDAAGGFDERFFLYYDEIDLCRELAARGGSTWFLAGPCAVHTVAGCSGPDPFLPRLDRRQSLMRYIRKHHRGLAVHAVRLMLLGELAWQYGASMWSRDRERRLYARFLKGLLREER